MDYVAVGAAVVIGYLLVWPVGEYAFLDDWAYVKSLSQLHETGTLRIMEFNPMSLVGHLFWGALFTKLFGLSFTTTKVSVTALHLIESMVFLKLLHLVQVARPQALAVTAALMFHPLHFFHCHTFLTDVPAVTWQVLAMYCFARGLLRTGLVESRWVALGSATAGYAYLCRQNGIVVLAAVAVWGLIWGRTRLTAMNWCALLGPATAIVAGFTWWYYAVHGATQLHQEMGEAARSVLLTPSIAKLPYILFALLMYLGLAVAPVALAMVSFNGRPGERWTIAASGGAMMWVLLQGLLYYGWQGRSFPYLRNVISRYGVLGPNDFLIGERTTLYGKGTACVIACLLVIAAGSFTTAARRLCTSQEGTHGERDLTICLMLWLVLQMGYFLVMSTFLFDRHLIPLIPAGLLVLAMAAGRLRSWNWITYAACMVPLTYYAVAGARDVHSMSRQAFQIGCGLAAEGVDTHEISAGYAFDCWHNYKDQRFDPGRPPVRVPAWWLHDLLPDVEPIYIVSFSPEVGTGDTADVRRVTSVKTLLPPREQKLYLLELQR